MSPDDDVCEFEHPHPEHPCGQKPEIPGTPCRHCGDPTPLDGSVLDRYLSGEAA